MKIRYVCHAGGQLATARSRVYYPALWLQSMGHDVSLEGKADVYFFFKHFKASDIELAQTVRHSARVVFDVTDDHFDGRWRDYYIEMSGLADVVTCNTPVLAQRIKQFTARDAVLIPEAWEFPELKPRQPRKPPRLLWYGHASNLPSVEKIGRRVTVVTNGDYPGAIKWSLGNQITALEGCDLVVIPDAKNAKPPGRVVTALRCGRYVVADPIPAYEEFSDFISLDGMENIDEAVNSPVLDKIEAGQRYVRKKFSPQRIAQQWANLFGSI